MAEHAVLKAYFASLAVWERVDTGLFVATPLKDCLAGVALLPRLEPVVPIYSLSLVVWPTARH